MDLKARVNGVTGTSIVFYALSGLGRSVINKLLIVSQSARRARKGLK